MEHTTIVWTTRTGSCVSKARPMPASAAKAKPATPEMVDATNMTMAVSISLHAPVACTVADVAINSAWIAHQVQRPMTSGMKRPEWVLLPTVSA